ncbi:MAG: GNAT family N-acetyltransferase [Treponema sp.]|nr:GNAT family N-acetyltransferase [Treponema sp.]
MDCTFRTADPDEIDKLLMMRIEFVKDIHPEYDENKINELKTGSYKYIKEHMQNNSYTGFFGEVNNEIVCSTSLLIYTYPPLYSSEYRKIGHVLNFYTRKKFRNLGYGKAMMECVKEYGKAYDFYRLDLSATEAGYPLYRKCGFRDSERIMDYEL